MSRFNTMLAQTPQSRSITGVVDHWIDTLREEDRKEFLQAVNDPTIPTVTITHVMRQLGYKMSYPFIDGRVADAHTAMFTYRLRTVK